MRDFNAGRYIFLTVFLAGLAFGQPQTIIIPHIADGGGWQTTLVLTNTIAGTGSVSLTFRQEMPGSATQDWNLPFMEATLTQAIGGSREAPVPLGPPTISMPVASGATVFLHTLGTSSATSVGWAQAVVSPGIVAYAIFTQRLPGHTDQDGTAPGGAGTERVLVPFDNTAGFITSVAMVNPASASETIAVNVEIETGAISQTSISLPAQGHTAFGLADQLPATIGHRGLVEFYIARGSLSMIALRFNPTGGFTTAPVYGQSGAPIINPSPPAGGK
jgi:hypothetical protein